MRTVTEPDQEEDQEESGPGRPRQWGLPDLSFDREFVRQIDAQRKSGGTLKDAITTAKMKSAAKMKQGTGDVEIAVRKMIASGKAPSLENRYREAKWRIELNELMAENTLVNTSLASSQAIAARSQAIAAYFHKKHKKKRNEKR